MLSSGVSYIKYPFLRMLQQHETNSSNISFFLIGDFDLLSNIEHHAILNRLIKEDISIF